MMINVKLSPAGAGVFGVTICTITVTLNHLGGQLQDHNHAHLLPDHVKALS